MVSTKFIGLLSFICLVEWLCCGLRVGYFVEVGGYLVCIFLLVFCVVEMRYTCFHIFIVVFSYVLSCVCSYFEVEPVCLTSYSA